MGKNSTRAFAKKQESFRNTQRENSKLALTATALAVGAGAGVAKGALIHDFGELLESGYSTQGIQGNDGEFSVEGNTPVLRYYGGFLDSSGHIVGYFENDGRNLDKIGGAYNGDVTEPLYANVLHVGEKPANAIVIEDTDADGIIADLTAGNLTIDAGDRLWLTNDIEFNSVQGGISEMPAYTGGSLLTVPAINLIPEPTSLALAATVGAVVLGSRAKGLVGKLLGSGRNHQPYMQK